MDLKPVYESLRLWRRRQSRLRSGSVLEPFHRVADIRELREFFAAAEESIDRLSDSQHDLYGECFVCSRAVKFRITRPVDGGPVNWRETLECPDCRMINRWRGCIHLFEAICEPTDRDRVYLTERLSPVYDELAKRYPRLVGSEYIAQAGPGEIVELHGQQVRNEDITRLSFADCSLDAILCFDVLEHVPDFRAALAEFYRVLAGGGQLVLSVPFSFQEETNVRAVIGPSGHVEHLLPPCYHGDPLSAEGVLSYYDFGMDLLQEMENAGFSESFLVCYRSLRWGYPNDNVAYIARRLKR